MALETSSTPTGTENQAVSGSGALRKASAPLIGLGLTLGAATFIGMVNPSTSNIYPLCPTQILFGVDCPGCGGLRCVHEIMNGNLAGALDQNLLITILLPLVLIAFAAAIARRILELPNEPPGAFSNTLGSLRTIGIRINQRFLVISLIVLTIVFTVARNLPFVPYLGSGIG